MSLEQEMMRLPGSKNPDARSTAVARHEEAPLPEAYQRAPTLMVGRSPETQGAVRVWSPSKRRIKSGIAGSSALMIAWLIIAFGLTTNLTMRGEGITFTFIYAIVLVHWIKELRRPSYITTDAAGIALTTASGSRSLRWLEIVVAQVICGGPGRYGQLCLTLQSGETITAAFIGYPQPLRSELIRTVVECATLVPDTRAKQCYVRKDALLPPLRSYRAPLPPAAAPLPPAPPQVGDLGISFRKDPSGALFVEELSDYSLAAEAGLFPGDEVTAINGWTAEELSEADARAEVTGAVGKVVDIVVRRAEWSGPLQFQVEICAADSSPLNEI